MLYAYLDGASNTPVDRLVSAAMQPFLNENFVGNSMATHGYGTAANLEIERARTSIATELCVKAQEIFFTSGATEGNNWVIKSVALRHLLLHKDFRNTIVCSSTEHASVLNCCHQVEEWGMRVVYADPSSDGRVHLENIAPHLNDSVALVCVMAVNNETGTNGDIVGITDVTSRMGIPTLVDCTQALGCGGKDMELGVRYPKATFMTFSAHKIYGPLGCGCLIARKAELLEPLIVGGAQEHGLRGGTMNTAGIVGMAAAVKALHAHSLTERFNGLMTYLQEQLNQHVPGAKFNVIPDHSNIASIQIDKESLPNVDSLAPMLATQDVAVSAGSACDSHHNVTEGDFNGSHVLLALGLGEEEIRRTIRVSFTKYTQRQDIKRLVMAIKEICAWQKQ